MFFFEIIDVTPLAETDSVYLSTARKVVVSDSMIFFADWKSRLVYGMDRKGHLVHVYGSVGHAGNEYIEVRDLSLSSDGSCLEILDTEKLLRYDIASARFVSSLKIPANGICSSLPADEKHHLLYAPHPTDGHSLMLMNDADGSVSKLRDNPWFSLSVSSLVKGDERILILPHYGEYTIDCYEDGALRHLFRLDLGDKVLPDGTRPQNYEQFEEADKQVGLFRSVTGVAENKTWLYAEIAGPGNNYYMAFVNKNNKRIVAGKVKKEFPIAITGMNGNNVYGIFYPEYITDTVGVATSLKEYVNKNAQNPLLVTMRIAE